MQAVESGSLYMNTGRFLQTRVSEYTRAGGRWILSLHRQQREVSYGGTEICSRPLNVPFRF